MSRGRTILISGCSRHVARANSSSHGCSKNTTANFLAAYHAQCIFHTRRLLRRRCSRRRRRRDGRLLPQTHPRRTTTSRPRSRPNRRRKTIHRRSHHTRTVRGTQVRAPRWVSPRDCAKWVIDGSCQDPSRICSCARRIRPRTIDDCVIPPG